MGLGLGMDLNTCTSESSLPDVIGVARAEIVKFRKGCKEGEDWVYLPSRRVKSTWKVLWTPVGMLKLKAHFKLEDAEIAEVAEKVLFQEQEYEGTVVMKARNPRMLICKVNRESGEYKVLVKDNKNFTVGMKVPLRKDAGIFVAKRHPRFGGKW